MPLDWTRDLCAALLYNAVRELLYGETDFIRENARRWLFENNSHIFTFNAERCAEAVNVSLPNIRNKIYTLSRKPGLYGRCKKINFPSRNEDFVSGCVN